MTEDHIAAINAKLDARYTTQGNVAFWAGHPIDANPHEPGFLNHSCWANGWVEGRDRDQANKAEERRIRDEAERKITEERQRRTDKQKRGKANREARAEASRALVAAKSRGK